MRKLVLLIFLFVGVVGFNTMAQMTNTLPVQNSSETDGRKGGDIFVSASCNKLYVFHAPENSYVEVRNMLGEKVFVATISIPEKEEFFINLKKGIYIVKIGNFLQRIIIK